MSELSSSLSLEEARVIAEQYVGTKDFEVCNVQETVVSNESAGFLSDYLRFEIRVRTQDGAEKTYKLFAKTVPRNTGAHRDFVLGVNVYVKEVGFYRTIVPLLLKHQVNTRRTKGDGVIGKWAPKCFFTREDIVVMEDLDVFRFQTCNPRHTFEWNQCAIILKKMASFHAASIIFEEKEQQLTKKVCSIGELYPEYFTSVVEKSMPDDETKGFFKAGVEAAIALVPYLSKYQHNAKLQRMIQEKLPSAFQSVIGLETSQNYRNVVCHGDLWISNILFCYGNDNLPKTVRFVDYQVLRYAPPATDIAVFIHTTTNREFRERLKYYLLKVYYDEFASELLNHGLSAVDILSFEELRETFDVFSPAGRAIAGLYCQLTVMNSDKKISLFSSPENYSKFFLVDRSSDVRECFQNDSVYKLRVEETLNELIEKDILKRNLQDDNEKV